MSEFLHLQNIHKRFGALEVLRGIDLQIDRGECVVLLGGSGCGKTTLLNIVAGLLPADRGTIDIDGVTLDAPDRGIHVPARQRRFGMVFQDFSLWPNMTVAENIAFGLRVQRIPAAERSKRVDRVLQQVHMEAFRDQLPGQLSGGQQQRVAIARALAVRPRVLLFDEPLSALDARLREELRTEIAELVRSHGITAIYVTHDQLEAFSLADRIALMHEGEIAQLDTPEALYQRPSSRFVAEFLGAANLFRYERADRTGLMLSGDLALPPPAGTVPDAGHVIVHRDQVRIELAAHANGSAGLVDLEGVCRQQAFLGERHEIHAEVADGMVFRGFSRERIPAGAPVRVRFAPEAAHCVPS